MTKQITIAIDAMGGDHSPDKTIEGVSLFLNDNKDKKDFILNLYGDKKVLEDKIDKFKLIKSDSIIISHSEGAI